jgi:hypothetical protein
MHVGHHLSQPKCGPADSNGRRALGLAELPADRICRADTDGSAHRLGCAERFGTAERRADR